uniref:Cuticle protein n=1 Tax=Sitodiplosis mosellana TaxID=263140 RepID=A0A0F6PA59_9DIPT|nr:cuticle protein [Sitodiplosis mosellana]
MFIDRISLVISILSAFAQAIPIEISGEAVPEVNTPIPIISQTDTSSPDGSFSYSFETGNHIKQQANGYHKTVLVPRLRADGSETGELDSADVIVQTGSYSYIAPDGTVISVHYIADENGFQAFGDHLPTPPPIPEPILNALQSSQKLEEQPTAHELLASQDNAIVAIPSETAMENSDGKQRQQRSSSPLFLPPLLQ